MQFFPRYDILCHHYIRLVKEPLKLFPLPRDLGRLRMYVTPIEEKPTQETRLRLVRANMAGCECESVATMCRYCL